MKKTLKTDWGPLISPYSIHQWINATKKNLADIVSYVWILLIGWNICKRDAHEEDRKRERGGKKVKFENHLHLNFGELTWAHVCPEHDTPARPIYPHILKQIIKPSVTNPKWCKTVENNGVVSRSIFILIMALIATFAVKKKRENHLLKQHPLIQKQFHGPP